MADEELALETPPETQEESTLTPDQEAAEKLKSALGVKIETIGTLRVKMSVTVPRSILDERLGEQFKELKRDAQVPGFRKGHAPVRLIEKRFGHDVGDQLVTQLLGSSYLAAIEKEGIKPVGDPLFWVKATDDAGGTTGRRRHPVDRLVGLDKALDHFRMPADGDLTYSCEVELRPKFDLPKLEGIPIKRPKVEVTDEDVALEMDRARARRGRWEPAEDGVIQVNDLLYGDFRATVGDQIIFEETNVPLAARDQIYGGVHLESFADALIGKKPGDTATVHGKIRDDHEELEMRGKDAVVEVKIHEIKRMVLPEKNDEFFQGLGFANEEEMRTAIRQEMDAEIDHLLRKALRGQLAEHLLSQTVLELPEGLSQRQVDRAVARRLIDTYGQGVAREDIEQQADQLRAEARDEAINDLRLFFIMEKIADEWKVDIADEELNGAIAQIARRRRQRFDRTRDELAKAGGLEALFLQLRDQKIMDELLKKAEISETEGPKKTT